MKIEWQKIKAVAKRALQKRGLNDDRYIKRLNFEILSIEQQGAQRYYEDIIEADKKFDKNPHQLLLPWLLNRFVGDANVDPVVNRIGPLVLSSRYEDIHKIVEKTGKLPHDIRQDDDKPDIDIDCLPEARNQIKDYLAGRYGKHSVASVGTWQTYLLKQAIMDAYSALGLSGSDRSQGIKNRALELTKILPDNVNEMREGGFGACKGRVRDGDGPEKECGFKHKGLICPQCQSGDTDSPTIAMILRDYPEINIFIEENKEVHQQVIDTAVRLVGRIKHAGKHAGGIIIADRDLFGNVPMQYDKKTDQWVSVWTEGRNTQLSKFGYIKWDILGLKNLSYIKTCCEMIHENYDISFGDRLEGLDESDPKAEIAGYYWKDGIKTAISLNDPDALKLASESQTDSIFQFDTELAKRTLSNGVKSFHDLLIFNAMGHPGPMQCVRSDSKITTDVGLIDINKLDNKKHKIGYLTNKNDVQFTDKYDVFSSGKKKIYKIKLVDGTIHFVSANHRFLTARGYVKTRDITKADKVARTAFK